YRKDGGHQGHPQILGPTTRSRRRAQGDISREPAVCEHRRPAGQRVLPGERALFMEARLAGGDRVKRASGAARIFVYNWPIYAGTWALAVGALVLALERGLGPAAVILGSAPAVWSVLSLLVSFHIYDRSPLLGGRWLSSLLPTSVEDWATIHAGLDAEVALEAV